MTTLSITAGPFSFRAHLEEERAPKTCEAFSKLLPFEQKVIHVRWSGESTWIPLGDFDLARHLGLQMVQRRLGRGQLRLGDAELRLEQRHLLAVGHRVDFREQLARGDLVVFLNQVADEVAGHLLRGDVDDVRFDEGIVRDRMREPIDHPPHGKRRHQKQE